MTPKENPIKSILRITRRYSMLFVSIIVGTFKDTMTAKTLVFPSFIVWVFNFPINGFDWSIVFICKACDICRLIAGLAKIVMLVLPREIAIIPVGIVRANSNPWHV